MPAVCVCVFVCTCLPGNGNTMMGKTNIISILMELII